MPLRTAVFSRPTALTLGAATSDRVNCGAAADITGFTTFSGGALLKITTLTDNRQLCAKTNSASVGWGVQTTGTTGNVRLSFNGAAIMIYDTNSTPLKLNRWQFVAWTVNTALGAGLKAHFYASASPDSAMVEATYAAFTEGSAPAVDTASEGLCWGNSPAASLAFQGSIALGFHVPGVVWSLDQFQAWQRDPLRVLPSMRVFTILDKETGLLTDRTGLGHDGTVT